MAIRRSGLALLAPMALGALLLLAGCGIAVPDLSGMAFEEAQETLAGVGLDTGEITYEEDSEEDTWTVILQSPGTGDRLSRGGAVDLVLAGPSPATVPNVVGMTSEEAADALTMSGLAIGNVEQAFDETTNAGLVVEQLVSAETTVPQTTSVGLIVSKGPKPREVLAVEGKTQEEAIAALEAQGFTVEVATAENGLKKGTVISQEPRAGAEVAYGSQVMIRVSSGITGPHTPSKGSAERTAILDALRPSVEKDVGQSVVFRINHIEVDSGYAFVNAQPLQPNGNEIDYRNTVFAEAVAEGIFDDWVGALLVMRDGEWHLLEYCIGNTDYPCYDWTQEHGVAESILR